MSVFALRVKSLGGVRATGERHNLGALRDLRALLEAACVRANTLRGGEIYAGVIILALTFVNGALSDRIKDSSNDDLAHQAAVIALSVATSMQCLLQEDGSGNGGESKFANSLAPQLDSMTRCLEKASANLTRSITSPNYGTFFRRFETRTRTEESSRELQASYNAFSFRVSFFMDNQTLASKRRPEDVSDYDGLILTWDQVDSRESSRVATHSRAFQGTFWENTHVARIDGKEVIIKTYPDKPLKGFLEDLKLLRTNRHNHLPSLFGFSKREILTPFMAISMESFIPFFEYLPLLCRNSPQSALGEVWDKLIAMRVTVEYLDNKRILESASDLFEIIESAVVDATGKVVLAPSALKAPNSLKFDHSLSTNDIAEGLVVIYKDFRSSGRPFVIDHLPRMLRPLRYALIGSPSVMLHTPPIRGGDAAAQEQVLRHWRPLPDKSRSISWPIPCDYQGNNPLPAVGDIGRFSRHPDGRTYFLWHANMQREIGGSILDEGIGTEWYHPSSRITRNIWKIPYEWKRQTVRHTIPEKVALNFLSANAERLGRKYDTFPIDLVLVTTTDQLLHWGKDGEVGFFRSHTKEEDQDTFVYAHFDDQGRLLHVYQSGSPTPIDMENEDLPDILPIISSLQLRLRAYVSTIAALLLLLLYELVAWVFVFLVRNRPPQFIQIEEDELQLGQETYQTSSTTSFKLGDIGCFATNANGARKFNTFCNTMSDLVDFNLQPWERNDCENIGAGVWRSQPVHFTEETTVCFSWTVNASTNLPSDLERFYVYFVASEGGTKAIPPGSDLQMVTQAYYQVNATYSPPDGGDQLRLFVHFDELSRPERSYWSTLNQPANPSEEPTWWPGCTSHILPSVSNAPEDSRSSRIGFDHQYRRITGRAPSRGAGGVHPNRRLGDVGMWMRDAEGCPTDQWRNLGRIVFTSSDRKMVYSHQHVGAAYVKISDSLWCARIPRSYPLQSASLDSRWIEDLPPIPSHVLSPFVAALVERYDVPPDDIMVVSKIVTNVRASATSEALTRGDNFMPMEIYREDKNAQGFQLEPSSTLDNYINTTLPEADVSTGSAKAEGLTIGELYGDFWDSEYGRSHDLKSYVVFPSGGGCHALWTSQVLKNINLKALSRLDLKGWQVSGCEVKITLDIGPSALLDICRGPGEAYSKAMMQDDGSERVSYSLEFE